jgi:ATP synthase protein I
MPSWENGMSDEQTGMEPVGEDARIDTLEQRLKAARKREDERIAKPAPEESNASYREGNRVLAELIGGLAGTSPWGLLVMLFVGVGVAFRNIIRISSRRP